MFSLPKAIHYPPFNPFKKLSFFGPTSTIQKRTIATKRNMSSVQKQINTKGEFVRKDSHFRNWIKEKSEFPPESGRYHLYISHACPWAHRTAIVRQLKGLQDSISISPVEWLLGTEGWHFSSELPDPNNGFKFLRQIYEQTQPDYEGSYTVPVLYDKIQKQIVNNESSEIIRMLDQEFQHLAKNPELHLYPQNLREKINEINDWIYPNINNGVYRCGFAQSQEAYDTAFKALFEHLDKVETILSKNRYLTGSTLTEADVRLFTTLLRFDPVYVTHFKCNKKRISDYPNIYGYLKELYQFTVPGGSIKETVNMYHIKHHYYVSHQKINPYMIVANGFEDDLESAHGRSKL